MDRALFESRLLEATRIVLDFTPGFIMNKLPAECRYLIYPNCSYDAGYGPIGDDEERFPEDSKLGIIGPVEASEVVDFLWRNRKVPQWIDVNVRTVDDKYTYIRLICCGRFMGDSHRLYHEKRGIPPFQCLGPHLPLNWQHENDASNEKFDITKYPGD